MAVIFTFGEFAEIVGRLGRFSYKRLCFRFKRCGGWFRCYFWLRSCIGVTGNKRLYSSRPLWLAVVTMGVIKPSSIATATEISALLK